MANCCELNCGNKIGTSCGLGIESGSQECKKNIILKSGSRIVPQGFNRPTVVSNSTSTKQG